ncbi:MAG: divalent-cation tolerance protein CutA [Pseudanabaena sp.]|nr:MAG: divalent-cation tolerance protein CutA [Pseudanabaena sp.]
MSNSEPTLIVVMTTFPEINQAQSTANLLVEEKLAACVQVMPTMMSTYIWEGKLCHESEHLVLIKTLQTNYERLVSRLRSLHPYETPEIIAIPAIAVDCDYLNWASAISNACP